MKKRIVTPVIALFLGLLATSVASGKTVALWPVEYDVAKNAWNPFGQVNAVDGSYPLYLYGVNTTISTDDLQIGWELPPNPDPSVPLERARNRRAVAGLSGDGNKPVLCCENLGADYMTRMHDYTVEMYVKLLDLPTGTGWYYLFGALNKDSTSSSYPQDSKNRWMVTLRHDNSAGNYYWNHYSDGGNVGDKKVKTLTNDFTVDGWFKPEAAAYDADANRTLFGTRDVNVGWTLFFTKNSKFGHSYTIRFPWWREPGRSSWTRSPSARLPTVRALTTLCLWCREIWRSPAATTGGTTAGGRRAGC